MSFHKSDFSAINTAIRFLLTLKSWTLEIDRLFILFGRASLQIADFLQLSLYVLLTNSTWIVHVLRHRDVCDTSRAFLDYKIAIFFLYFVFIRRRRNMIVWHNVLVLRLFMSTVVIRLEFPKVSRDLFHVLWLIGPDVQLSCSQKSSFSWSTDMSSVTMNILSGVVRSGVLSWNWLAWDPLPRIDIFERYHVKRRHNIVQVRIFISVSLEDSLVVFFFRVWKEIVPRLDLMRLVAIRFRAESYQSTLISSKRRSILDFFDFNSSSSSAFILLRPRNLSSWWT